MKFNVDKCHVIKFGKSDKRLDWEYKLGNSSLQRSKRIKKIGNDNHQQANPNRSYK